MPSREVDFHKLKVLGHRQNCEVNWFEEGGGEVCRIWDMYFLFEIPQYGGEGQYAGAFTCDQLGELLELAYSWT